MLGNSNADEKHKRIELHKLNAMLSLCEQVGCRRQALLKYFDDHLEQACNNCDTCLEPVQTWDGSVAAQQGLSCIYRTGQRFGVSYLIDVLRGKVTERMQSFGHDRQSTFAIGKYLDEGQWRSVFRQLIAKGMVEVDLEGHGGLTLAAACRPVLRGEATLMLRKDVAPVVAKAKSGTRSRRRLASKDSSLWEALREKRKHLAEAQDVPPFVIFHDATLMQMIELHPTNQQQLLAISGVGDRKLALYGDEFLAVLDNFKQAQGTQNSSAGETLEMLKRGLTIEQIAEQRELKIDTVYVHLAQSIEQDKVQLQEVVELATEEIKTIEHLLLELPVEQGNTLKPVYEALDGGYSYGVLRCVRAAIKSDVA
jgi:ATP-dependent DNA helicase RecQ